MRWESVFQSGPEAAFVLEGDLVVAANRAAGRVFGCEPEQLVGLCLPELVASVHATDRGSPEDLGALVDRAKAGEPRCLPLRSRRKDGGEFDAEFRLTPLPGKERQVLVNVRELAADERTGAGPERALSDNLPVGVFRAAPDGRFLEANEAAARILGYEATAPLKALSLGDLCTESAHHDELLAKLRADATASGELRVRRRDGRPTWVWVFVHAARTAEGEVAALKGVILDIADRKKAEDEARTREQHYRTLVHNFPEGAVVLFDCDLRLVVAESATLTAAGFPKEALEGRSFAALLPAQTFALVEPTVRGALAGQDSVQEVPFGGRIYNVHVRPVKSPGGEVVAGMAVVQDITARKRLEDKLRYLSAHDPLTNLFNRLFFEEEMARLAKGRHFPISIVSADVDGLKAVNDHLGHAAGDELLRQAAEVLRVSFRPGDVVARIGGDEFAVLLPGASAHAGEAVLLRVRRNEDAYSSRDDRPAVHFSLGLATADEGVSLAETLRLADSRMYRDKLTRAKKK